MSGLRPTTSFSPRVLSSAPSDTWLNWKPEHPKVKALGCAIFKACSYYVDGGKYPYKKKCNQKGM